MFRARRCLFGGEWLGRELRAQLWCRRCLFRLPDIRQIVFPGSLECAAAVSIEGNSKLTGTRVGSSLALPKILAV